MPSSQYTFHGVPKPPAASNSLMQQLGAKLCALAITAPRKTVAFGGVSPSQTPQDNLRMCIEQLSNPRACNSSFAPEPPKMTLTALLV